MPGSRRAAGDGTSPGCSTAPLPAPARRTTDPATNPRGPGPAGVSGRGRATRETGEAL